jgi:hypothetical protein
MSQQIINVGSVAGDGTGDKGQVPFNKVNANFTDLYKTVVAVTEFGATGNGVTDDSAAINAALSSGALAVLLPAAVYRCASGITVPQNVTLYSFAFAPTNPRAGTKLLFDLSVPTCVTLGGAAATNGSGSVRGFIIDRAAGTPPAGSIGLLVQNTYAAVIQDIGSFSHQIPVEFLGDRASKGITCMVNRLFTGAAYDSHVVIDTFPEVRFNQCRFGMDGLGDQTCNSYLRIQGGSTSNPANGPNTVVFDSCQFNQGANTGTNWLAFQNQLAGSISDIGIFQFNNCYIEDDVVGIFSDSTWPNIINLFISNTIFNPTSSTQQFLGLNAATEIENWHISNCNIKCAFTVAPTAQINFLCVDNTEFLGLVSITSPTTGSTVLMGNVVFTGGLTLVGSQGNCKYEGAITGGSFIQSGLTVGTYPLIDLVGYNGLTTWVPTLEFGGASTGITYSVQQGLYQINKNVVTLTFSITLTSKGSATGTASIINLPVPENQVTAEGTGGGPITFALNLTGLTGGALVANVGAAGINLYETGAAGIATLADTNFTATSTIRGTLTYTRA